MIEYSFGKGFNGLEIDYSKISLPESIFITQFDDDSVKTFQEAFSKCLKTGQSIIPIYIDSPGGDVSAVLGMIDIIKCSPVTVATVATGFCASAGTILLSSGAEGYRYASPLSQLMLHDLSAGVFGKEEEIKSYTKYIEKLQDLLYSIYDKNCEQDKGYFKKFIKKTRNLDLYISADKAKEINLINHLGIPKFVFGIETSMSVINPAGICSETINKDTIITA